MFSNRDLRNLIFPLFVKQFLLMLVGIADTFIVSFSSEADDAGAALCRSAGNARATMYISAAANIINILGNCIGVFALGSGAAGVAVPSLISRMLSAVAVTAYCFREKNGVHQLVKVALSCMVALFGTYQIAANGVAQSIWSLASIMGLAMAPAYTTVIGRCMGAGDIDSANFYFKKPNKIALLLSILWNAFVFFITPLIVRHSAISPEAKSLVIWLVLIHNMFNGLAYPFAGSLGNGLRAAGDVMFTMLVSIFLTIAARLFFSVLFGLWLNWGVIGIAAGMSIDLVLRGILFLWRYQSQKWTKFQVI